MRKVLALCVFVTTVLTASGCATGGDTESDRMTVMAAASLRSVFGELAQVYEDRYPGRQVELSFAGSSDLSSALIAGAHADVFASADEANMQRVADANLLESEPVVFAENMLTIVTAPGNPLGIASLGDLAAPGVLVVSCAPQVPCGSAAARAAAAAGLDLAPVSEELSVTDVLGKVTSGQADAGLVYVTDAQAAGTAVTTVDFPQASAAVNSYPIAALTPSDEARDFIELVTSEEGQRILRSAGFMRPA